MDAYSMDLRTRVVEAVDEGEESQKVIAERFNVSDRWIRKILELRKETGSIAARPHGGGRMAIVSGPVEKRLKKAVKKTPDATLDELLEICEIDGSRMCIWRALNRLAITRKKSR